MRTTYPAPGASPRYRRPRRRRRLTVLLVLALLLGTGAFAGYRFYQNDVIRLLTIPGCQAGSGNDLVALDFGQAQDAAVIAGVAARDGLPARALVIAYATAYQESKLENLHYGDRDSVGVFQQRPSQGWGSAAELEDPAFATQAFFKALVKVPRWQEIPVYQAAQDVQRSADGYAYQQYTTTAQLQAADFTTVPHTVTCWYVPASQAASLGVPDKLNLTGALAALKDTYGSAGPGQVVTEVSKARSGRAVTLHAAAGRGWTVASWLVANAGYFGITQVRYAGYQWSAGITESSWQAGAPGAGGGIVAS